MEWRGDLIEYRLEKAQECLEDARVLSDAGRWNACVNRLYYACFYAVAALLAKQGLSSVKHTGIRSLFNRHYVKTSKVSKISAQVYKEERFEPSEGRDDVFDSRGTSASR